MTRFSTATFRHFCLLPARPIPYTPRPMKDLTDLPPPKRRQKARARFAWFVGGSVANYLLIATPFKWLKLHTALPTLAVSACSIGVGASFFFVWNYFINFRGDSRKRDALPRYLGAVLLMSALSSGLLTLLKGHDSHHAFSILGHALDLDIVATQFFLAGLKFFLYHKWVFPLPKEMP